MKIGFERWIVSIITALIAAAFLLPPAINAGSWAVVSVAGLCGFLIAGLARRLPVVLIGGLRRRPLLSIVWFLLALIAAAQIGRLSAFMTDSSRTWGSVVPDPAAVSHQCMSAYVLAADLARHGEENLYAEKFYPAFSQRPGFKPALAATSVIGLSRYLQDPYQYPPQFLLLPRAALALSNNFMTIRTVWFVLQTAMLIGAALLLCRWIGGRDGVMAGLLLPAVLASAPVLMNLQFGQFHAMTVIVALAALWAFESNHAKTGGALLAFTILAKVFPAVLLVYLALQRRWREIGWTLVFGCAYTALGLVVLGTPPFTAFLFFELPRYLNEEAFSFMRREGVALFIIARNFSIEGFLIKIRLLGMPIGPAVITLFIWAYTLVLLWFARVAARKTESLNRLGKAQTWLALLNLASFRTPLVPSVYAMSSTVFVLWLLAPEVRGRIKYAIVLAIVWLLIMGGPPLPDRAEIIVDLLTQCVAVAVNLWVLLRKPAQPATAGNEFFRSMRPAAT